MIPHVISRVMRWSVRRSRTARRFALVAGVFASTLAGLALWPGVASAQGGAAVDLVVVRARQLHGEGRVAESRALLDSLVQGSARGSNDRAEAMFWRASLAADSTDAARDYATIIADFELSPRVADALLRLGESALARGDRAGARAYLERLVLEHRARDAAGEAWYHLGRMRIADGALALGCAALDSARQRLRAGDVERRGQIAFASQGCRALAAAPPESASRAGAPPPRGAPPATPPVTPPVTPPATPPARDRTGGADAPRRTAATDTLAGRWSVQVAAYRTSADAERQVRTLKTRGFAAARIDSLTLFHVRVGAYRTRAEASALATRMRAQGFTVLVVEIKARDG